MKSCAFGKAEVSETDKKYRARYERHFADRVIREQDLACQKNHLLKNAENRSKATPYYDQKKTIKRRLS